VAFPGFLAEPWFVLSWYGFGMAAAAWALYDMLAVNTAVNPPLKAAWPIIFFFFSILGLALYWLTCRPSGIAEMDEKEADGPSRLCKQYVLQDQRRADPLRRRRRAGDHDRHDRAASGRRGGSVRIGTCAGCS